MTLAFHPSLGTWLVPDLVSSFRADHPDVQFHLLPQLEVAATTVGARRGVDMELSTVRPHPGAVRWAGLAQEPLFLAAPAAHDVADRDGPIDLAAAADEPFVLLRPGSALRETTHELAARAGFTPHLAFECEDLGTARAFVAAGLGVSILPTPPGHDAADSAAPMRYLPLTDHYAVREIGVAWSEEHRMLPAARLFHQHVLSRRSLAPS